MRMNDNAPTHKRRKLVKTYQKMCSLDNEWCLLRYAERPSLRNDKKKMESKNSLKRKKLTPKIKGGTLREINKE